MKENILGLNKAQDLKKEIERKRVPDLKRKENNLGHNEAQGLKEEKGKKN